MLCRASVALFVMALAGCGDDAAPAAPPGAMLAGPYARDLSLNDATRTSLPAALESIAPSDEARFYWYASEVAGGSLGFDVRAETTALEAGSVVHHVEEQVGEAQVQGMIGVGARDLNRGGAQQGDRGPRWLEGLYSVRIFSGERELATVLFEVR